MVSLDPEDKNGREEYLIHLRKAKRFKKFLSMEEIRSFLMPYDYKDYSEKKIEDLGIYEICDNYGNLIKEIDMMIKRIQEYGKYWVIRLFHKITKKNMTNLYI